MASPFSFNNLLVHSEQMPTLLLVDDVPGNIKILIEILSKQYKLLAATNGVDALEIAREKTPQLILLDIVMPEMDGYEICQQLKQNHKTAHIPIIFISGLNETEDKVKSFQLGGVDYINKPFQADEVKSRIQVQLKLCEAHKRLEAINLELGEYLNIIDRHVLITCTDLKGTITSVSQAFCQNIGYHCDELIGHNHRILRHPDTPDKTYAELWKTVINGGIWKGELSIVRKDGEILWHHVQISPTHNASKQIVGYSGIREDITDKKRIEMLSMTDELTGLLNRRKFNIVFPMLLKRARRDSSWFCFMILDVDNFKNYNDIYGHVKGDQILTNIGKILRQQLHREGDFAFRLGGEEFGALISVKKCSDAEIIAESIRAAIETDNMPHKGNSAAPCVTISMGYWVSQHQQLIDNTEQIYVLADQALYRAKENGRNKIELAIDLEQDNHSVELK